MATKIIECTICKSKEYTLTQQSLNIISSSKNIIVNVECICNNGHTFTTSVLSEIGKEKQRRGFIRV